MVDLCDLIIIGSRTGGRGAAIRAIQFGSMTANVVHAPVSQALAPSVAPTSGR